MTSVRQHAKRTSKGNNWQPEEEEYVQKWPRGAWDKFADKKNLDPMVYENTARGLLFPV